MCCSTLSVGWRGEVDDCDFSQMRGLQLREGDGLNLWNLTTGPRRLISAAGRPPATATLRR